MPNERNQSQSTMYCLSVSTQNVWNRQIHRDNNKIIDCLGLEWIERLGGDTAKNRISFGGNENVLKMIVVIHVL